MAVMVRVSVSRSVYVYGWSVIVFSLIVAPPSSGRGRRLTGRSGRGGNRHSAHPRPGLTLLLISDMRGQDEAAHRALRTHRAHRLPAAVENESHLMRRVGAPLETHRPAAVPQAMPVAGAFRAGVPDGAQGPFRFLFRPGVVIGEVDVAAAQLFAAFALGEPTPNTRCLLVLERPPATRLHRRALPAHGFRVDCRSGSFGNRADREPVLAVFASTAAQARIPPVVGADRGAWVAGTDTAHAALPKIAANWAFNCSRICWSSKWSGFTHGAHPQPGRTRPVGVRPWNSSKAALRAV